MWGGVYFAAGPFAGTLRAAGGLEATAGLVVSVTAASLTATGRFKAAATITLATAASLTIQVDLAAAAPQIRFSTAATLASPYGSSITIGGSDVRGRVRRQGFQIRDVLNDAPNTCSLTLEGDPPAVGQAIRITLGSAPPRVLFAGTLQTVAQRYDLLPHQRAWDLTAIDDTARANAKRPFGSWVETSASQIAQTITATHTTLSPAGIATNLPAVGITFDGSDTFIAALVRLANAIGGYAKVEDGVVYLFIDDTAEPPDPLDDTHPPLNQPRITINTDASQLRTRVYGKGYGETIRSDVLTGETLLPIQDGVQFPIAGGEAIAGQTADGAQSLRLRYTGVVLQGAGTLVGPGAAPGVAPALALAAGSGVDSGVHTVALVFVTANGRTMPSPVSSITVGQLAGPVSAPVAGTPTPGVGPDEGTHDYLVTFVTAYGETNTGASSNAVATSAVAGQLPAPGACTASEAQAGAGVTPGVVDYKVTFTNATGESTPGPASNPVSTEYVSGQVFSPPGAEPGLAALGSGVPDGTHAYWVTFTTANGESAQGVPGHSVVAGPEFYQGSMQPHNQIPMNLPNVPVGVGITGRKLYRGTVGVNNGIPGLIATINNNAQTTYLDTTPTAGVAPPQTNTTGTPAQWVPVVNIPIGSGNTTGRRLYRRFEYTGPWKLVASLTNNTETTYLDKKSNAQLGADAPTVNTSGSAVQQIPLTAIPLGPLGVTARKLYRRFNLAGAFYLVATLPDNTKTTHTDTITNSGRGAAYTGANTAIGNRIDVLTIPVGAATVTARELYLSPAGGGLRKLAVTLADNVTTTATISMSDAVLAGQPAEPTSDTSGLSQPTGQVNPGATALPLAAATTFYPTGGWVVLGGGQVVRYTGISGQQLVGIPPSGPGAITTTVLYGSQALPSPMLLGVTGVTVPLLKGSAVHIWVQRDDLQAQAEQRARAGGDGIIEYVLVDMRRGLDSLTDRCDADLAMFARPILTVGYATHDVKTKSGKPITITLPGFTVPGSLVIQDVTITDLELATNVPPKFTVRASTVRFSLEDTLRRIIAVENKGIR
jgi:hypothetical protein